MDSGLINGLYQRFLAKMHSSHFTISISRSFATVFLLLSAHRVSANNQGGSEGFGRACNEVWAPRAFLLLKP